jgi:hypothetical protein
MTFRLPLVGAVPVLLTLAVGCSTFTLADHSDPLAVPEHPRARDAALVVLPFAFVPEDPDDAGRLTEHDLARWQRVLAAGLDQTNILESVVVASEGGAPPAGDYTIGGRITRFRFQKNWIPTFIPIHLSLSFLTFTGHTLFGGATAATVVRFTVDFELTDVRSGALIHSFEEDFTSTRKINVYSEAAQNPYENPSLVFSKVVDSAAAQIASSLP